MSKKPQKPKLGTRIGHLDRITRNRLRTHFLKQRSKDTIVREMYNGWIKFNIMMDIEGKGIRYPTSITLKKNIVALWLVMMDKIHCDHNRIIIEFIEKVCLKRWKGETAKGMSEFIQKCMIHAILDSDDWENYKIVYKSLNGRVKNHKKLINTNHGDGHIRLTKDINHREDPKKTFLSTVRKTSESKILKS